MFFVSQCNTLPPLKYPYFKVHVYNVYAKITYMIIQSVANWNEFNFAVNNM